MAEVAFFLHSYNDIDNIIPVIWKFMKNGSNPIVIFGNNYDYKNDYRIKYLQNKYNLAVFTFPSCYGSNIMSRLYLRIQYLFGNYKKFENFLIGHDISACIFEWEVYYSSKLEGMFFGAAKNLKIPTIGLPHGVNIYTNTLITELDELAFKKTGKVRNSSKINDVDLIVEPNYMTHQIHVLFGFDSNKSEIWGSARYYPEWARINQKICPTFIPSKSTNGKLKVVFMLPHWQYKVNVPNVVALIDRMASTPWIYLIVKDHTRSGHGGISEKYRNELNALPNVEASVPAHSSAITQWSDVVINFGSSISLEVILQDKTLINPVYCHANETIFEKTESTYEAISEDEVFELLERIQDNTVEPISDKNKNALLREAVFGGSEEYDILDHYWKNISVISRHSDITLTPSPNHVKKILNSFLWYVKARLYMPNVLIHDSPAGLLKKIRIWILQKYFNTGFNHKYDSIRDKVDVSFSRWL